MTRLLTAIAVALALCGSATAAAAMELEREISCLRQAELDSYLGRAFKEARIARGTLDDGTPIEIFAGRNGSWTMVELTADGFGCIHSYGHGLTVEHELTPMRPPS